MSRRRLDLGPEGAGMLGGGVLFVDSWFRIVDSGFEGWSIALFLIVELWLFFLIFFLVIPVACPLKNYRSYAFLLFFRGAVMSVTLCCGCIMY